MGNDQEAGKAGGAGSGERQDKTVRCDPPDSAARMQSSAEPAAAESEASSALALPAGTRLREFEISRVLGEGGFSIVYEAWDHSLHRKVALKEYIPAALAYRDDGLRVTARSQRDRETYDLGLQSFINEARLLATFDHPSLVKVHQFWNERGSAYMVMPLYQGATLKQLLADGRVTVDEQWLKDFLRPILEALAVIHAQHCFHRDIAPDNILILQATRKPLLLDFGAARQVVGDRTQDLTVILKNGYAPIEQYGQIPGMKQGPWTDIYALGAVVHFILRGRTPPPSIGRLAEDTYEPLAASLQDRYSQGFLAAVDRALAARPEQRIQTIEAFGNALGLNEADVTPPRPTPAEAAQPRPPEVGAAGMRPITPPRRSLSAVSGLVIGVGLLAVAGAAYWTLGPKPPGRPLAAPQTVDSAPGAGAPADTGATRRPTGEPPDATRRRADGDRQAPPADVAVAAPLEKDLRDYVQLSRAEKRDAGATLADVKNLQAQAAAARQAQDFTQATALDRQADDRVRAALDKLIADLVKGYSTVAEKATSMGNYELAQQAVDRAKAIQAMRR